MIKKDSSVSPSVVAAITASLLAGGYISRDERISSICHNKTMNLWKRSGVIDQMQKQDLMINIES
ncbi:MAG: hypothetical protein K9L17_11355 [Clostridiales bacterium]|nr:hypothetical protein [Clostridiales bacterium]MCF8023279.1 hypothetical protein [Clostridiales bacterium]